MVTETSGDLSTDELAVLMIAEKGESMIPIGRWEEPIKSLAAKGYMTQAIKGALGSVNYIITDAGRRACIDDEDAELRGILTMRTRVAERRSSAQHSVEQAAIHLAAAAKASAALTGDPLEIAARRWHEPILRRALELLNG